LLVLEDLHWADQGTLDLLLHLARNLQGARLLVIGTYRDVEVDRGHPLSATLAELRRGADFSRVLLRGLGTPEVQRMLAAITGSEAPGSLAESIHRQTEGNPLFVQEVVRYLVEEGHLGKGGLASGTAAGMSIPEGLRDVIGRRLSRLSPDCNRVLAVSAVIGRDFGLETLQTVADLSEEQLLSALEEAVHIGVLEEQSRPGSIRYRFAHAFFQQTLYEELIAPRRLRLHQQVAAALEKQYASRLEEHAAELAEHFAQSTGRRDLRKAVRYGELAALRAMGVYAYGEAVRHLEQALAVQQVLDPDDKAKRCDLLLAFGEALGPAGESRRTFEVIAPEALALAESTDDQERASRACRLALQGLGRYGAAAMWGTPAWREWAERADRYAAPGTSYRVAADVALAMLWMFQEGRIGAGRDLLRRALELARELDDPGTLFRVAPNFLNWVRPEDAQEQRELAEEIAAWPRDRLNPAQLSNVLWACGYTFLNRGDRARAEALWREMDELTRRIRNIAPDFSVSLVREIWLATLDGKLESAAAVGPRALAQAEKAGNPAYGRLSVYLATCRLLLYLGRGEEVLSAPSEAGRTAAAGAPAWTWLVPLCLAHLGRRAEAQEALNRFLAALGAGDAADALTFDLTNWLETAVLVEDREAATLLAQRLAPVAALASSTALAVPTCIARHLGAASALLGDRVAARRYDEQALDLAGRMRHRPESALVHLQLAELLLAGPHPSPEGEGKTTRAEALEHLDFAIAGFREMKMQPSLERALRHKDVLKA